ncbi:PREDICTED: uncharacterized protein LOC109338847 [Lupinus angustifolius]|uniref:uncharacterized protein LOC109338847 n=1 Tax=Lupinus angustifolius TaxID=3871 RepID=UPI00092F5A4D|nr:PREDICTED: uncharacterized protein LOC109338847 [Lupinus angustifolius]
MTNPSAARDMRLVGRLWADDKWEDGEEMVEDSFTEDISPLYWSGMNLKLFVKNDRNPHMPNIWGICRTDLLPIVTANSRQQISISLTDHDIIFFLCDVYAHTHYMHRRLIWSEIRSIMIASPGLWCCIGDFNVVFRANEYRGSDFPPRLPSEEFKSFSDDSSLLHLLTRGAQFTWSNKRIGDALTEKRLGRCLCNVDWLTSWNEILCCTLTRISSDHHPLLLSFSSSSVTRLSPFRFHIMWLQHLDCKRVVVEVWKTDIRGCPMFIISQKLKLLKRKLRDWNINFFGDLHLRVKNSLSFVEAIQNCINNYGPNEDLLDQEAIAQKDLLQALVVERAFWKEKSRMNCTVTNDLIGYVIPSLVSEEDNLLLTKHPSNDEIRSAIFSMNGDGAPGPDGFGGCFYQAFWDIAGPDVCQSVAQFFSKNWLLPNLNSNIVVLIPKHLEVDRIEDFRPIALANFQFKVINKVLADRLVEVAPKITSPQQRGFIKDRHIHECVYIASEAINLLDHKVFGGNLAIKLDIRKAFDTLDWSFLLDTLTAFGFNSKFTNWVKIILHSAKLSINVNGQSVGFFSFIRGVRQGDPLSPFLFCLAEDVLNRGISKLILEGQLCPIYGPSNLFTPGHVLYVDDILIFYKGIKRNLLAFKKLVTTYAQASGQHISLSKCRFYSASDSPRRIFALSSTLGFSSSRLPFNYLGVPLFKGKPRKVHLQAIADRIILKLASWKASNITDIFITNKKDQLVWQGTMDGSLTLKVAYNCIKPSENHMAWCKTIWNYCRFQDNWTSVAMAKSRIKMAIFLSGNISKLCANGSQQDFTILRNLNVSPHYNCAPAIIEVLWYNPLPGWIKINSDGAAHGAPGHAGGSYL